MMTISSMISVFFNDRPLWKVVSVLLLTLVLYSAIQGFNYARNTEVSASGYNAAQTILNTAKEFHIYRNGNPDFSIVRTGKEYGPDYQFWQLLESMSGDTLVTTDKYRGVPVSPTGRYIYVSCVYSSIPQSSNSANACDDYLSNHPSYVFMKRIYDTPPFIVYLAKDIAQFDIPIAR